MTNMGNKSSLITPVSLLDSNIGGDDLETTRCKKNLPWNL